MLEYNLSHKKGRYFLENRTKEGAVEFFEDLIFHGGPGSTLEMRVFSEKSLTEEFIKAGFSFFEIISEDYLPYGIIFQGNWSLPILAVK